VGSRRKTQQQILTELLSQARAAGSGSKHRGHVKGVGHGVTVCGQMQKKLEKRLVSKVGRVKRMHKSKSFIGVSQVARREGRDSALKSLMWF